jgi:hypothetical protein
MAFDVFVSHSSKDKATADAACAVLESRKIRCWIAPRDIRPGADWGESIIEAIKTCRIMVLVFSQNANDSVQIKREVERAIHHGATIIPLRIEDILPTGTLEYSISSAHWLDAYTPPLDKHLHFLADTIIAILEGKSAPKPKPGPKAAPAWRTPAIVGGVLALALLCVILEFAGPHPIQGDWTLDQPSVSAPVNSVFADLITSALTGPDVKGSMQIKSMGQYTISITGTDSGTATRVKTGSSDNDAYNYGLTFTSNSSHKSTTLPYMFQDNNGNWGALGVPAGDKIVMFGYNSGAGTVVLHGNPDGTSGGDIPASLVGTWTGSPFNMNPPNELWGGTLALHADGTYLLTVTHQESGIVTTANGSWTAKPSNAVFGMAGPSIFNDMNSSATYGFSGSKLQIATTNGTLTWRRGW